MRLASRLHPLLLSAFLAAAPFAAQAADPTLLFSYEATALASVGLDPEKATYDQRAVFTNWVLNEELPKVLAALEIPAEAVETQVTPGGYLLETNASLQSQYETSEEDASRFAAAVGFAFHQGSILVTDFTPAGEGSTGYVVVSFVDAAPTGDQAQAFFEHAAAVNEGLGGGYTAFGMDLYFLNVVGGDGQPYSGLTDADFLAGLTTAAETYEAAKVEVSRSGRADARFVENDWEKAPNGEQYAEVLGAELAAELEPLKTAHEAALLQFGTESGWK